MILVLYSGVGFVKTSGSSCSKIETLDFEEKSYHGPIVHSPPRSVTFDVVLGDMLLMDAIFLFHPTMLIYFGHYFLCKIAERRGQV